MPIQVAARWLRGAAMAGCAVAGMAQAEPLPEPLTLEHALTLADDPHPDLVAAAAERDIATAQRDLARSAYGINASLNAEARWIEPAERAFVQSRDDSQAHLRLSKRLYDFGHTRATVAAADAQVTGRQLRYADARLQRSLLILERYLDVLRADLEFRVSDEAMAIAYVRFDRIQDKHELGQVSDVDRLEIETRYQQTRSERYAAQARQRTSRVRLASALNRPGELSSALAEPDLTPIAVAPPPLETVLTEVLQNNPTLLALRAEVEAAQSSMQAARALDRPVISAAAEASDYQRETGSSDPWAVGVQLEVPLYRGGRSTAQRAQARAEQRHSEALLAGAESELRETVQLLWENIQVLRASREESQARVDYRELYLDRSRALYEMEVSTDLGDAMVFSSAARLQEADVEYQLLLDWARLNALRGHALFAAYVQDSGTEGE